MSANNYFTLVTGASDGFGKALAIECAKRGMNLVLVALPGPELNHLAAFIRKNFGVQVTSFGKDLTNEAECYDLHLEVLSLGLKINTLINNAGIGNTAPFTETSPEFFKKQIKLNVLATTLLTSLLIPELKKNTPSCILNVGSLCSFFYLPQKQVYGGTKSFIYFFSKSLRRELKEDRISVSVVCPGGMNTNFHVSLLNRSGNWLSRISILEPEEAAPIVIRNMLKGKEVIIPGVLNKLSMLLDKILPASVKRMMTNRLMKTLKPVKQANPPTSNNSSPMAA
jgi:short-subunit dehydrogenase